MAIRILVRLAMCLLVVGTTGAARQTPPIDVDRLGPPIGAPVPDFSGADQFGRDRNLASILGEQGAMIVFFRSADW